MNSPSPAHEHHERLHAMDALRAVAMLLGILLHAAMPYMTTVWFAWAADDAASSPVFDALFWFIHAFRMQVFFLIAGFFACMLALRYGPRRFARHRLRRIGLPLLLGMVTVVPLCNLVWVWGLNVRAPSGQQVSFAAAIIAWVIDRPVLSALFTWHLWFLVYLLFLYGIVLGWMWLAARVGLLAAAARVLSDGWAWCIRHALAAPVLAVASFPLLFLQSGAMVDTQKGPLPDPSIVVYYLVFFAAGWMLYARREVLASLARSWVVLLVVGLLLTGWNLMLHRDGPPEGLLLPRLLSAFGTAALVVGVCGLFLRCFGRHSPTMRYISDSAYWVYFVHLPIIVAFNILLLPLGADAFTKFALVVLLSTVLMYVSYHFFVRYTRLGVLFNGPRLRDERARRVLARAAVPTASPPTAGPPASGG